MLHADRIWVLNEVPTVGGLARKLAEQTWCLCQAFMVHAHPRYVWLNDSTSENAAQEFAVIKLGLASGDMKQIESITFSWCNRSRAKEFVLQTLNGKDDHNEFARQVRATIQSPEEHGICQHCA